MTFFWQSKTVVNTYIFKFLIGSLLLGIGTGTHASSIPDPIRFKHVMSDEAHTVGSTLAIHQDKFGFMWFAGKSGLARFDGYENVFYRHDPEDPTSISNDVIWDMEEDEDGNLWLATEGGLNRFIRETQTFERYQHDPSDPKSIRHDRMSHISIDKEGNFWAGTMKGLDLFIPEKNEFIHYPVDHSTAKFSGEFVLDMKQDNNGIYYLATGYGFRVWNPALQTVDTYQYDPNDPTSIQNNLCRSVLITQNGEVWVGTEIGIHQFHPETKTFTYYPSPGQGDTPSVRAAIWQIFEDSYGEIWIAGDGGGVSRFDRKQKQIVSYQAEPSNPNAPFGTASRSVYEDVNGDIWIGHFPSGVSVFERYNTTFQTYRNLGNDNRSINNNSVRGFAEDAEGNLWIATDGGGLNFYDAKKKTYTFYTHDVKRADQTPSTNNIQDVFIDSKGNVWVGMWNGGAARLDTETGIFTNILAEALKNDSVPNPHVIDIAETVNGDILLGSMDGGLTEFNPTTEEMRFNFHNPINPTSLSDNRIWALLSSKRSNDIWVGTHEGLNRYNPKTKKFKRYQNDKNNPESLGNNWVHTLYEDKRGLIWVGTHGGGISILNPQSGKFTHLTEKEGIANNIINAFAEDDIGNMWFSSIKGLTRYNIKSGAIRNFTTAHGIQGSRFNRAAAFKTRSGDLIFGGTNGFTRFNPREIEDNHYLPPTHFTKLEVNNVVVDSSSSSLSKNILLEDSLQFDYKQNIFTLYYAALNFRITEHNHYAYMLEGFDDDWQYVGKKTSATYTNLGPGNYVFKVKGTNNEGRWSENPAEINIHIIPPPWRTWWAYCIYAAIIISIIGGYLINQRKIINYQSTIVNRLRRIDKVKDEFIASTSHELKTPLFGIVGIAENILDRSAKKLDNEDVSNLSMIISSSKRLASQVQDILDHSSMCDMELELERSTISLYEVVNLVVTMLQPMVNRKSVKLQHELTPGAPNVFADASRLQQVLYNLIINAIKHTKQGSITIASKKTDNQFVQLSIQDTGSGIEKNKLKEMFGAFVQANNVDKRIQGGTGLGLTIANNLIKLHGGSISIDSDLGIGTTVKFTLPISAQPAKTIALSEGLATKINAHNIAVANTTRNAKEQEQESFIDSNTLNPAANWLPQRTYHILVVDDEAVNRIVLTGFLKNNNYKISTAENGMEALAFLNSEKNIDLILLDVMMPGMSGYEVCEKIRTHYTPSSLPILFITAKGQIEDLESAFQAGGNDFLPKPVTKQELLNRVALHLQLYENSADLEKKIAQRTQELQEAYNKLEQLSIHDALTGLYNRHFFEQIIDPCISETNRYYTKLEGQHTVLPDPNRDIIFFLIDVDNFKAINDTYGHQAGDDVLAEAAERLSSQIRESDYFIRWGGEEFILIARNTSRVDAIHTARRLLATFGRKKYIINAKTALKVTCSIGYCCYPPNLRNIQQLDWVNTIELADKCLYAAKQSGKNTWVGIEEVHTEDAHLIDPIQSSEEEAKIRAAKNSAIKRLAETAKSFSSS